MLGLCPPGREDSMSRPGKRWSALVRGIPILILAFGLAFVSPASLSFAQAVDNFVWVPDFANNAVLKVDKATPGAVVETIDVVLAPTGIAVDPNFVWVASKGASSVVRITKATGQTTNVSVGSGAIAVAVDSEFAWVANFFDGTVSKVDRIDGSVVATIAIFITPTQITVDPDFVWVASDGRMVKIDKTTLEVSPRVTIANLATALKVDSDFLWLLAGSGQLQKINKVTNSIEETISLSPPGIRPQDMAVDDNFIWVSLGNFQVLQKSSVLKIDKATLQTLAEITVGYEPNGVSQDADFVWVTKNLQAQPRPSLLVRINKSTNAFDSFGPISTPGVLVVRDGTWGDGTGFAYDLFFGVLSVGIDIKPGSDPNSINLSSAGVIPVAILSSASFDATTVDPDKVFLAGAKVKMVGKGNKFLCSEEDVNGDTLVDLVCKVETVQFMIEAGDSTAVLEAETFDGQPIEGSDTIRIVPD